MFAVKIAVWVDHLWFEPQTKLHAQGIDMGHEITQALGEFAFIWPPVAQCGAVVVTSMKPTIIQYEALDSNRSSGCGQLFDLLRINIKVEAFPSVQMNRPRPHLTTRPVQPRTQFGMEIGRQTIEALRRAARHQLRRVQCGASCKQALARCQPLPHLPLVLRVV